MIFSKVFVAVSIAAGLFIGAGDAFAQTCLLDQPIELSTNDLIGNGIHLTQVVFDSAPLFPNSSVYNPLTDSLNLDGFEVLTQDHLTGVLGATVSVAGSSNADAVVGFDPDSAAVFDGAGEMGFYDFAPDGSALEHFWSGQEKVLTPSQISVTTELKIELQDSNIVSLQLELPVLQRDSNGDLVYLGEQQLLCVKSANLQNSTTASAAVAHVLSHPLPKAKNNTGTAAPPQWSLRTPFTSVDSSDLVPTFTDDFNLPGQATLDPTKWDTNYFGVDAGSYVITQEVTQAGAPPKGVVHLRITASGPDTGSGFKSHIGTENTFSQKYGRFEIRAKFSNQPGFAPAFWLWPVDNGASATQTTDANEIDIFEHPGSSPFDQFFTVFSGLTGQINGVWTKSTRVSFPQTDFSAGYHVLGLDWTPTTLSWLVDGATVAQSNLAVAQVPFFILIDNQVSGEWGHPSAPTFPNDFLVDWVHVYQHSKLAN